MPTQSTSQKYSNEVFSTVQKRVQEGRDVNVLRQYKGLCKRSGGILRTVGLIQYLVFLQAKSAQWPHYEMLLNDLLKNCGFTIEQVRTMSLGEYMQATRRVLLLLQWHKRIADILIQGNFEEEDD